MTNRTVICSDLKLGREFIGFESFDKEEGFIATDCIVYRHMDWRSHHELYDKRVGPQLSIGLRNGTNLKLILADMPKGAVFKLAREWDRWAL